VHLLEAAAIMMVIGALIRVGGAGRTASLA